MRSYLLSISKSCFLLFFVLPVSTQSFAQIATPENKKSSRPNIIFIMSDDHAYQAISAYGYGLNNTPNIDKLAKNGMLFTHAFVNNSLCAPSRASIISGKYSNTSSVKKIGDVFDGNQTTFPRQLQRAGYQTAFVGKWHLYSYPTGFDYWNMLPNQGDYYQPDFIGQNGDTVRMQGYVTNLITDDAIRWMSERDKSRPFCILVWNKAPHRNWMPEVKYLNEFDSVKIPEPTTLFDDYATRTKAVYEQKMEIGKWLAPNYDLKLEMYPDGTQRYDDSWSAIFSRLNPAEQGAYLNAYKPENDALRAANMTGRDLVRWKYQRYAKDYLRTIQTVDDNVGRITAYLEQQHLDSNTIVVYTSDQGFYVGEHGWFDKRFMYRESFRTPLIVSWPGVIRPNAVSGAPVMNLDIGETFLDAAGVEIPSDMQGKSFLPILKGETPAGWRKYVYYHYYESGGEHNVAKHVGVRSDRYKLIYFYENDQWEFYDLNKDPGELNNVYGKLSYKRALKHMKAVLETEMKKFGDTLN